MPYLNKGAPETVQDQMYLQLLYSGTIAASGALIAGITSGTSVSVVFAVAGAALLDQCTATTSVDPAGLVVYAAVSSAGNVRVTYSNVSGGTITPGAHNILLQVFRIKSDMQ